MFGPLSLTLILALIVTLILLIIGTPLAWWLATTRSKSKPFIEALTALPLVLPPPSWCSPFRVLLRELV